jgi:hypothetical protein
VAALSVVAPTGGGGGGWTSGGGRRRDAGLDWATVSEWAGSTGRPGNLKKLENNSWASREHGPN